MYVTHAFASEFTASLMFAVTKFAMPYVLDKILASEIILFSEFFFW